ncbi:MAG: hypothetical protein ACRDTC_03725 [Pseudonocardiaceae bacterium]
MVLRTTPISRKRLSAGGRHPGDGVIVVRGTPQMVILGTVEDGAQTVVTENVLNMVLTRE